MASCFHTSSTKDPLFCFLFWGMSFAEFNSNKVISHQSLWKKFSLQGSSGTTDPLRCPVLGRALWRGYIEREVVHKVWLANCCVCSKDAPRQDILETRVERALAVYHERVVWQQLFSQWTMKRSYQYKSLLSVRLESLTELTDVGWDTDFVFLHYNPFQMKWGRVGTTRVSEIQTLRQWH